MPSPYYTFQARFDGGDWENWTGNWRPHEVTIEWLKDWYEKHWGPESRSGKRLKQRHRVTQFRLAKGGEGNQKLKTVVLFPEIR
jgi:hypothetical protein